jgi:uncharacterized RDD family membrane protein YckC
VKWFRRSPARAAYAGFWRRTAAVLLDSWLYMAISLPLFLILGGAAGGSANEAELLRALEDGDILRLVLLSQTGGGLVDSMIQQVLPMIAIIACWMKWGGTPGKLLMGCAVVDAASHRRLSFFQAVLRYIGYFISSLPLGLGFLWVAWHPRRQGFHDLIAKTVVLRDRDDLSTRSLEELARPFAS